MTAASIALSLWLRLVAARFLEILYRFALFKLKFANINPKSLSSNKKQKKYGKYIAIPQLESIKITKAPNKTTYIEGQDFDKSGMKVIAKYSDNTEKEVTNYTITDGDNLAIGKISVTISYTEDGVTKTTTQPVTVTKGLEIVINEYNVINQNGQKYIIVDKNDVTDTVTVQEVLNKIKTNENVKMTVCDKEKQEITDKEIKVLTGIKVKISVGDEEEEFTIVVRGDIDGNGETTINDLFELNKHRLGKVLLEGEELIAGDLDGNGIVDIYDLFKMNYYRTDKK